MRLVPTLLIASLLSSCSVTGNMKADDRGNPSLAGITVSFNPLVLWDYLKMKREQEELSKVKPVNPVDSGKNAATVQPNK